MKPIIEWEQISVLHDGSSKKKTNWSIGRPPLGPQTPPVCHPPQPRSLRDGMKGLRAVETKLPCVAGRGWKQFLWLRVFEALDSFLLSAVTCELWSKGWRRECKGCQESAVVHAKASVLAAGDRGPNLTRGYLLHVIPPFISVTVLSERHKKPQKYLYLKK